MDGGLMTRYVQRPLQAMAAAAGQAWRGTRMLFGTARNIGYALMTRTRYDYRSEVRDPSDNSAVIAVVGWVARNFPDAPVTVTRLDVDGSKTLIPPADFGPGAMLRLLERPNQAYGGVLQWSATIVDYYAHGDAYWLKVRNDMDRVVGLWWIPQQLMEPRWPQDRDDVFVGWYDYTVNGVTYEVPTRDVVHFRYGLDPNNRRKGRSPLKSVLREVFTDDEAANFTASLVRNMGVPGVVIAPANTTGPLRGDAGKVKEQFRESFGGDNRGDPMVLTAPTEVKVLSFNPEQMQLRDIRKLPEERISGVVGVAAIVAGLGAGLDRSTFSNFGEARRAAYTEAVIPLQRQLAADLEVQLLVDFPDSAAFGKTSTSWLDVAFDWTMASAMQEALDAIWRRAESAATKGLLKRSEFRQMVHQPVDPDGADDVYIVPNNFVVLAAGQPTLAGGPQLITAGGRDQAPQDQAEPPAQDGAPADGQDQADTPAGGQAVEANGNGHGRMSAGELRELVAAGRDDA